MGNLLPRPDTPVYRKDDALNAKLSEKDDKRRLAVILLQRLIKGRAM